LILNNCVLVPTFNDASGALFGLFKLGLQDNLLHLTAALWATYGALKSTQAARTYLRWFGLYYTIDAFVGMLPPKLAQIMLNLATKGERGLQIWDPFCGLGTTLIEAFQAGYSHLLGSDIADDMVIATQTNTSQFALQNLDVFYHDARRIDTKKLTCPTVIVTEGMLGHNFTP
jgi:hypothetical protein